MTVYAVTYDYSDDTAARDEHRPAHRDFLGSLAEEGVLKLSGPLAGQTQGALIIVEAGDPEAVRTLLRDDPFQQWGLVERVEVREWTPVLGCWLV